MSESTDGHGRTRRPGPAGRPGAGRKRSPRPEVPAFVWVAVAAFVLGLVIGLSGPVHRTVGVVSERIGRGLDRVMGRTSHYRPAEPDAVPAVIEEPPAPAAKAPLPPAASRPFMLIVIDDVGFYMPEFKELLPLHPDLTYSVLPHAPGTEEAISLLQADGRQYMLHMPMEYKGWPKPDPCEDCILRTMTNEDISRRVKEALVRVRPVGMNNHMGSALTSDPVKIRAALKPLVGTGLFFLDSRTIGSSKAYEAAVEMGIPALGRHVFLDDDPDEAIIERQYQELVKLARKQGYAIAIGHPKPGTVAVLQRHVPELKSQGIDLVRPLDYFARLRWREPLARAGR